MDKTDHPHSIITNDPSLEWRQLNKSDFGNTLGPIELAYHASDEPVWLARMTVRKKHLNLGGVCHGGVLLSLVDIAMGTAAYMAGGNKPCATIQLDSQFLSAAKLDQALIAIAKLNRRTKDISFMKCELWGGGRQVLSANGVWKYLSLKNAASLIPTPAPNPAQNPAQE